MLIDNCPETRLIFFLCFNFINRPFLKIFSNNSITPDAAEVEAASSHATTAGMAGQRCHPAGVAKKFSFRKYFLKRLINKIKT